MSSLVAIQFIQWDWFGSVDASVMLHMDFKMTWLSLGNSTLWRSNNDRVGTVLLLMVIVSMNNHPCIIYHY